MKTKILIPIMAVLGVIGSFGYVLFDGFFEQCIDEGLTPNGFWSCTRIDSLDDFLPNVTAFEPAMNKAPLSYFGYYDDHGDKVDKLIVGKEYFIKAQFYWPESYSQPYEFIVEIHDDKKHRVIERFSVAGELVPNKEMSVYFSWVPKEPGEFRNYSELRNSDESTVLTGIPQYDFQVLEPTDEFTGEQICGAGNVLVDGICVNPTQEYFDAGLNQILLFVSIGVTISVVFFVIIWKKRK